MARLSSIHIENFRCFKTLTVTGLTRVNLFVGRNNSGKTALLEAVEAAVSENSPFVLYRASVERGEYRVLHKRDDSDFIKIDVRRWFHGHRLDPGIGFKITTTGERSLSLSRTIEKGADPMSPSLVLKVDQRVSLPSMPPALPLGSDEFLGVGSLERFVDYGTTLNPPVAFIPTRRLSAADLLPMWSKLVLTPSEADVVAALRTVEPTVARFALTGSNGDASPLVLFAGRQEPVPLGSLGEGATRMLTLALSLSTARGGFLLIDEVESGLHYTAHRDTWRLIIESAKRLDVQVFATTHSKDCLEAIARLHEEAPSTAAEVTVHRLEAGMASPVRMTAATIAGNVETQVDVR